MRRRLAAAAFSASLVTALLVVAPGAAAAEPDPPAAPGPLTIQPFYAPIEADGDAVPDTTRRRLAPAEEREPTAEDARELAERLGDKSFSGVGEGTSIAAASTARKPPASPDESYLAPCWDSDGGRGEHGRVYNRFEWCQRGRIGGIVKDEDGDEVGRVSVIFRAAAYGRDDGNRDVRVFLRSEPGSAAYQGDQVGLRSALMHVWADCDDYTAGCTAGGATAGKTMDDWNSDGSWHSWTVASADNSGVGPYQVSRHLWHLKNRVFSHALPGVPAQKFAESHTIRCDSATVGFARSRSKACIFDDVIPHLQYSATSTKHGEVARHIQCALDSTCTSYPLKDGKQVPGKFVENRDSPGLHRITEKTPAHPDNVTYYAKNSYQKDQACQQGTPYFTDGLPPALYKPPAQQCDEFPFASTKEGAGVGDWNFSVLGVTAAVNRCAGIELKAYYRNDRILVWQPSMPKPAEDPYYVHITDVPDSTPPGDCVDEEDEGEVTDLPPTVDAGANVSGDEGSVITLGGSAADAEGTPSTNWTYAPGTGTDPGASCAFTAENNVGTGITCTDDGVYTVTLTANDGVNGSVSDSATVTVYNVAPSVSPQPSPSARAAAADSGIVTPTPWQVFRVGSSVKLTADFTDPGLNDTHVCAVNWDDGSTQKFTSYGRQCVREHTYTRAGMFTISTGVTDDDGGIAGEKTVMVIVYDPDGGWANVDGSYDSPAGALPGAPAAAGEGWLHLTGRYYPQDKSTPVGAARNWMPPGSPYRFDIQGGTLEWLVVTPDGKVAAKTTGTLAGTSQRYGIVLYAYESCTGATRAGACQNGPDRVRTVIWPLSAGAYPTGDVFYDSRASAGYDVDVANPLSMRTGTTLIQWP
ncbi:PKD domain-containing protein [Actinoplanes sp. DH11]|uniref:NucA/NucB deoxyribonuclease domain-containing protein n=1 Tax=Actinoplanes sp. DH11 TaxID=2857011 RepID=UPI001E6076DE|nr:PKD domain-containing protein [Actinoplanes sp. DH11]